MNRSVPKFLGVLLGALMVAIPQRIVDTGEALAFENPDEASLRPSTIPIARAEGIATALIGFRGRLPRPLALCFAVTGTSLLLAPNRSLDAGLWMAYREPERIRPKAWVVPTTRLVGVAHLLVATRRFLERDADG